MEQYDVLRPIGSGSFGQVFLVLHKPEGRYYVMKEVASLAQMEEKQRDATEQEVNLLSAIRHPNIVGYRESFVNDSGHLCIFMEYCEHGDICTYLQEAKKGGKFPSERQLLEWFVQIVLALHALHIRKILHRDLKTQNLFLTGPLGAFRLKLGDFGIAKVLSSTMDLAVTQIGTPFYMSPEVFNNKPYGYKSDVWGLGCVLYEIVNGQRPFEAQSINGLAFKVLKGRYNPITASCAEETKCLIKSMLSTHPTNRPTLQEVLHIPSIRPLIQPALQTTISAGAPEARALIEQVLTEQLQSLGLGGPVNGLGAGPRHDRRQIVQKLERAERRRKREEDTLRRLQKTAGLLAQYLTESSAPSATPLVSTRGGGFSLAVGARGAEGLDAQLDDLQWDDPFPPAMSHRDRVLLRKEHRRQEEAQRFEEEARKIREENLACQRAWVQGVKHGVTTTNLVKPFQSSHANVVHTPRRRQGEPRPPRPHFGMEPLPPHEVPPQQSGKWAYSAGRSGGEQPHLQATRSVHSVCLEALSSEFAGPHPDHFSEDSDRSPNLSDDCFSDVGGHSAYASDEQVRRHSLHVHKRIDACRAAIYKHQMTIEALQYTFAQEQPDGNGAAGNGTDTLVDLFATSCDDASQPSVLDQTGREDARRQQPPVAPAIVQDRVARLRRRCLDGLGGERFQAARQCLQALLDAREVAETARERMLEMLGVDYIGFYSLIDQIVYLECRWGAQEPPQIMLRSA